MVSHMRPFARIGYTPKCNLGPPKVVAADPMEPPEIRTCKRVEEPKAEASWYSLRGQPDLPIPFSGGKVWICDAKALVSATEAWVGQYVPIELYMVWIAAITVFVLLIMPEILGILYLIGFVVASSFRGLWKLFVWIFLWIFDDGESHEADASTMYSLSSLTANVEKEIKVDTTLNAVNMIVDDRESYQSQYHHNCPNHQTNSDAIHWRINSISNTPGHKVITPADFFPSPEETSSMSHTYIDDTDIVRQSQGYDYSNGHHTLGAERNKAGLVYAQVETYCSSNAASTNKRLTYECGYADDDSGSDGETCRSSGGSSSSIIPKSSNSFYHKESESCFSDGGYQAKIEDGGMGENDDCTHANFVPCTIRPNYCEFSSHQTRFSDQPNTQDPCSVVKDSRSEFKSPPEFYMDESYLHTGIKPKPGYHTIVCPIAMRERSIQVPSCNESVKASFLHPKYIHELEPYEFARACNFYNIPKPKDRDDDVQSKMSLSAQTRQDRVRPWLIQSFFNQTSKEELSTCEEAGVSQLHIADDNISKTQTKNEHILVVPKQKQLIAVSDGFVTEPEVSPRIIAQPCTEDKIEYVQNTEKAKPPNESSNDTFELEDLTTPSHFSSDEQARIENQCANDILHDKSNKENPIHDSDTINKTLAPNTIVMDITHGCRNSEQTDQLVVNVAHDNADGDDNAYHNDAEIDEYFEQDGTGSWIGSESISLHNPPSVSYQKTPFTAYDQGVPLPECQPYSTDDSPWTVYIADTEEEHVRQTVPLLDHLNASSLGENHAKSNTVSMPKQSDMESKFVDLHTPLDHQNMVDLQHAYLNDDIVQIHTATEVCQPYSQPPKCSEPNGVIKAERLASAVSSTSGGSGMVRALKAEFEAMQHRDKITQPKQRQPSAQKKLVHQWTPADDITHCNMLEVRERLLQLSRAQEEQHQSEDIEVVTHHSKDTSQKRPPACARNTSSIPSMHQMRPTAYVADQSKSASKVQDSVALCSKAAVLHPGHTEGDAGDDVHCSIRSAHYPQRFADVIGSLPRKMEQTDAIITDKKTLLHHLNQNAQHIQMPPTVSESRKVMRKTRPKQQQTHDTSTSTDSESPMDNMPTSALPHLAMSRNGATTRQSKPYRHKHGDVPLGSMSFPDGTGQGEAVVSTKSVNYLYEGQIPQIPILLDTRPTHAEPGQLLQHMAPMAADSAECHIQYLSAKPNRPCTPFGGDRLSLCSDDEDDSLNDFNLRESTTYVDMNNNSPRKYKDACMSSVVSFNDITETCYFYEESCASEISHVDQERIYQFLSDDSECSEDETPPMNHPHVNWNYIEDPNKLSPTSLHSRLRLPSSAVYTTSATYSLYAKEDSILV